VEVNKEEKRFVDEVSEEKKDDLVISFKSGMLSIVGQDLTSLDKNVALKYRFATSVDFSYNCLRYFCVITLIFFSEISNISAFTKLKRLVLDNNALASLERYTFFLCRLLLFYLNFLNFFSITSPIPSVELCSLNNNSLSDLQGVVRKLSQVFPNLKHLSLLKNPCCPSEMFGGNHDDYVNYRYYYYFIFSILPLKLVTLLFLN
jgi:hypothetical protein